ncbi:AP2 domain-containing protein [Clostridium sp. BJN0013]|uniref:AP2 domain-containing protein n=1 Tax=Clostridium sp. BJN0013 TaxID=3236840 RepID=UPI0034C62B52
MHRYLLNYKGNKEVDHINHKRYDNRKRNLRICSRLENSYNMPIQSSNTSGYKGVEFHRRVGRWRARISVGGKRIELGHFNTAFEAHLAYCKASEYYHGEYSFTG